jgi:hypothetical protein
MKYSVYTILSHITLAWHTVKVNNFFFGGAGGGTMPPHIPYGLCGLPSQLWLKCNRLLRLDAYKAQLRCPNEVDGDI